MSDFTGLAFKTAGIDNCLLAKVVQKSRLSKAGRDNLVTEIGLLKQLRHRFILELVHFFILCIITSFLSARPTCESKAATGSILSTIGR